MRLILTPRTAANVWKQSWIDQNRFILWIMGFPCGSDSKGSVCNAGDPGSVLGLGRSPGEGHGNPLLYSCLENCMNKEPGRLQSIGSQRVGHNWMTNTFTFSFMNQYIVQEAWDKYILLWKGALIRLPNEQTKLQNSM